MQVILSGSVFIYANDGTRYEIFQEHDLFRVKKDNVLNTLTRFISLDKAVKEVTHWANKFHSK